MNNRFTHRRVKDMRRRMLRNDPRCFFCLRLLNESTATIDHLIPVSRGGKTDAQNCRLSCGPCNFRKGNRTLDEIRIAPPVGALTIQQSAYLVIDIWTGLTIGFRFHGREWLREMTQSVREMMRDIESNIGRVGQMLREIEQRLSPDAFRQWSKAEFGVRPRRLRMLMQMSQRFPGHLPNMEWDALRVLSKPDVPQEAVAEAVRASRHHHVTVEEAKALIKRHRTTDTRSEIPRVCHGLTCEAVTGS